MSSTQGGPRASGRGGAASGRRAWAWACLAAAAVLGGCDGPGARPAGGPTRAPEPEGATTVAVVLPAVGLAETNVWEAEARREAVEAHALTEVYRAEVGDPPGAQAELIRRAASEGASALIVMADEPSAVADAIAEVRKAGTPVVLLDRKVDVPGDGPPPPLVLYEEESESAAKLVDAAIAAASAAGFLPDGPAVIVRRQPTERRSRARAEALRAALEARGVRVLPDVTFSGYRGDAKAPLIAASWLADDLAMVFTDEEEGLRGASEVRHDLSHASRRFVLSGYSSDRELLDLARYNACAAVVERPVREPMHRAFAAALALARGETVASEIRVPTPITVATGAEIEGRSAPALEAKTIMDRERAAKAKGGP